MLIILFQKAMHQFEWHDGSVKNVHVDVALLYKYQVMDCQFGRKQKQDQLHISLYSVIYD